MIRLGLRNPRKKGNKQTRVNKVTPVSLGYPLNIFNKNSTLTLSTAMNLVHRNCFPKLSSFLWYFSQLDKFRGGGNVEKHADPGQKNRNRRKSRETSQNLLAAFVRSKKEENFYGHCDVNNARRILLKSSTLLRGCWFWLKKVHFRKNFDWNFIAVKTVGKTNVL